MQTDFRNIKSVAYFSSSGVDQTQPSDIIEFKSHSKKCWVISTQSWVKYGQTQMLG